jgi:single-strand DNA-binding protein
LNRLHLIGNVGKDPEISNYDGDKTMAKFSLATSEKYKDKVDTEWHNLVAFGKVAELCEKYVHKGDKLAVVGKVQYRMYEKDGVKKYSTQVLINEIEFLTPKNSDNRTDTAPSTTPPVDDDPGYDDSQCPF